MQRKILISLITLSLLLAACQSAETPVDDPTATPLPEATATVEVQLPTPTPTATLEPTPAFPPDLNCGEAFCQAQWVGLLERPIGPGANQFIDLTYAYASTANGALDPHHGVEFLNEFGVPVLAAQDGEVVFAGTDYPDSLGPYAGFYGNVVVIRHAGLFEGRDVYTLYAHMSENLVETGQIVAVGEQIGAVGMTGIATGTHLHFEVRLDENDYFKTTNPSLWFSPVDRINGGEGAALAGLAVNLQDLPIDQMILTLELLDADGNATQWFYPVTYYTYGSNPNPVTGENFGISDLPPGNYKLSYITGALHTKFFTLEPGSLGLIALPWQ